MAQKRIILLLDGTWNDPQSGPADTNIVRLREIISHSLTSAPRPDDHEVASKQVGDGKALTAVDTFVEKSSDRVHILFYERGVGTSGFFDNLRGGAFGAGLARNVRRAYMFLSGHYSPGDEIFIFGFSRGAYTARSLAGYINAVGLLKSEHCTREQESMVWYYYRDVPFDRSPSMKNKLREYVHDKNPEVSCLAVFDTVGALGVPIRTLWRENRDLFGFHDVHLAPNSRVNLHALATDEHRQAFEASLWLEKKVGQSRATVEQVWFPGVHADIGGGYIDEEARSAHDIAALDDITLDWILKRVLHHFPDFPAKSSMSSGWPQVCPEWALAPSHESRQGFYKVLPLALRSVGNCPVRPMRWLREINVCYDRHATTLMESLHISVIERLGRMTLGQNGRVLYNPRNVMAAIPLLMRTYSEGAQSKPRLTIVGWSGERLDPRNPQHRIEARAVLGEASRRIEGATK